jgi:hypothetical protein
LTNGKVENVRLLGDTSEIKWKHGKDGLVVDLTDIQIGPDGYVLEITLEK